MFWLRLQTFLLILIISIGCSRFGVDSLIDENALSSSGASISGSLASNLKADMIAAGVDETSANLIANEALSLSSSLEGSMMMAYSISGQEIQANASLYQQVAEKFIEGAMAGIKKTSLSDDLKVAAAGVNSYTPIRTMAESASSGMSEAEKQAAVEAISAKAVAKLTSTGIDSSKLAEALTKISEKAVEGVSKSGVSASAAREMVKKAAGGATKGLSEMGVSAAEVQSFVSAVASGATKGISSFSSNDNTAATDLLADVTSGLSSGLADVQDNVTGFDMYTALSAAETSITSEATTTLSLDSSAVNSAVSSGQQTVTLPSPVPAMKRYSDNNQAPNFTFDYNTTEQVIFSALDNKNNQAQVCYTSDGITTPGCEISAETVTCSQGSTTYQSGASISIESSTIYKAVSCMQNKTVSSVQTFLFQEKAPKPTFSQVSNSTLNKDNNAITLSVDNSFTDSLLCYTVDQTTPTCALNNSAAECSTGTAYSKSLVVSADTIMTAVACKQGYKTSDPVVANYTYQLSPVNFVVNGSNLELNNSESAKICYRVGSQPECSVNSSTATCSGDSTEYSSSITPADNTKVYAINCKAGTANSTVTSFSWNEPGFASISFNTANGSVVSRGTQTFSATASNSGATVCVSTSEQPTCSINQDGSTCQSGTANSIDFNVTQSFQFYSTTCSSTGIRKDAASYIVNVEPPSFPVAAGALTYSNNTITIANHGGFGSATTCYTTDGNTPACSISSGSVTCSTGTAYTTGITLSQATTLKAISCQDSYGASSETSAAYTYQLSAPSFNKAGSMEITSPDTGATICYTSDGSSPACNASGNCTTGSAYSAPFSYSSSTNYKALTCKAGATTSSVTSSNLYEFSGIISNVAISSLAGWTQCYVKDYNTNDAVSSLTTACNKGKVLLGCRATGSSTLVVAANATRAQVFQDTGTGSSSTHNANNVQWYFSDSYSMGFAPVGATVNRNSCDVGGGTPPAENNRMCWHTSGGNLSSGWSCGSSYAGSSFERIAFHAD